MEQQIERFLRENGGIASVSELADLLELSDGEVRRWARQNGARRLGSVFAFDRDMALACADDLLGASDEDDEDDETDDDEEEDSDVDDEDLAANGSELQDDEDDEDEVEPDEDQDDDGEV